MERIEPDLFSSGHVDAVRLVVLPHDLLDVIGHFKAWMRHVDVGVVC